MLFPLLSYPADNLRRPVVLIVSGDEGKSLQGRDSFPRLATVGREAYAGESLETGSQPITFAYCPETSERPAAYTLAARSSIRIMAGGLGSDPALQRLVYLPICHLPQLDTVPLASTVDDPRTRTITTSTLESRIAKLPAADQPRLRQQLTVADGLMRGDYTLIGHATRAALLEESGLIDDSLVELRSIRDRWPGAAWTRDAISRLTKVQIIRPDVTAELDSSPGLIVESAKPTCDSTGGKTYALLIGISKYRSDKIPTLHYADQDAEIFEKYLTSARGGHLLPEQIKLLLNADATRDGIDNGISELVRGKAKCSNTLIVFVAAHGMLLCTEAANTIAGALTPCDTDAVPYILAFDSDFSEAKTSGIPMSAFREMITTRAKDFGRVLLFVDVCHAGRIGALPESTRLHSSEVSDTFGSGTGMLGILMGNSRAKSPQDELTYERSTYGHGIFTFYTLLGLNQGVEPSRDGKVYFSDLSTYVATQVLHVTDHKQWPSALSANPRLVAVDDANQPGITLNVPSDVGGADTPRTVVPGVQADLLSRFDDALHHGRLLPEEKDNASDLFQQLQRSTVSGSYSQSARQQLHVALEEKGQAVILKYLKGDQAPQVESDFEVGQRYFKAALELAPDASFDESRFLFCRGRTEIFEKKYAAAQRTLDTAIQIDPARAYAYNAIGIAYLEQISDHRATFDQAAAAFRSAISLAPYWAYPRHNLALTYAEAGKFDDAIRQYQDARLLAPTYSYLSYNLGLLYEQINDVSAARSAYLDALRLARQECSTDTSAVCPGAARAFTALGVLAESLGKGGLAEKQYQAALRQDPNLPDAKHDLASMWSRSNKQLPNAEKLWRENLAADRNHVPSLIGLSELLLKQRRFKEALSIYETLLTLRSNYGPAILGIASSHTATGNPQAALTILDQKRELLRDNAEFWAARARAHIALNDLSAARNEYMQAIALAATRQQKRAMKKEAEARLP